MEDLPFSVIENVYINAWQCCLLILLVVFVLALCHYKKFVMLVGSFISIAALVALQWIHFRNDVNVKTLAVYRVPGHSVIDLIDRGQTLFVADSLFTDAQKVRHHITPFRVRSGVRHVAGNTPQAYSFKGCRLIVWQGKVLLHLFDRGFDLPESLRVDWVIVGNNAIANPKEITDRMTCQSIVLDSSNSYFFASRFLQEAKLYKLEVHSVLHQGAFIQTIENQDS
jgi:competence protein ComEC